MSEIRVVPTGTNYVEGIHRAVDVVARERRYLGLVEGPPVGATRAWVEALVAGAGFQFVAVDDGDSVVGWCDIVRNPREGFRHCGQLGMGVTPDARGQGLGERLAKATIERAWDAGLERVELEVFASNEPAIRLYEKLGFVVEGVKRRARRLDGHYDDNIMMALVRETPGATS